MTLKFRANVKNSCFHIDSLCCVSRMLFYFQVTMNPVKVDIEYCEICNLRQQCDELSRLIKQFCPTVEVECHVGRQGSFEVLINKKLVHSRLACLGFPDCDDVVRNVKLESEGKPLLKVREKPITDCVIQ